LANIGDDSRGVGTSIDVVAEEHHSVGRYERWQTFEELLQSPEIAMDIADGEGPTRHPPIVV
jgi:hypothetical protein